MTCLPITRRPLLLAVVAVVAACAAPAPDEVLMAEYVCDDGRIVSATFHNKDGAVAVLDISGNRLVLPIVVSASGARYSDGKTTFWIKGDEAQLVSGEVSATCRTAGGR